MGPKNLPPGLVKTEQKEDNKALTQSGDSLSGDYEVASSRSHLDQGRSSGGDVLA